MAARWATNDEFNVLMDTNKIICGVNVVDTIEGTDLLGDPDVTYKEEYEAELPSGEYVRVHFYRDADGDYIINADICF